MTKGKNVPRPGLEQEETFRQALGPNWRDTLRLFAALQDSKGSDRVVPGLDAQTIKAIQQLHASGIQVAQQLKQFERETFIPLWQQIEVGRQEWERRMAPTVQMIEHVRSALKTDVERMAEMARQFSERTRVPQETIEALYSRLAVINQPWVSSHVPESSIRAFTHITAVAEQLRAGMPYSRESSELVNGLVGRWADSGDVGAMVEPEQRVALARAQGFDQGVVAIPSQAFPAVLAAAGFGLEQTSPETAEEGSIIMIGFQMPSVEIVAGPQVIASEEEHAAIWRVVRRVELRLRDVLRKTMASTHGADWMKQKVHGDILSKWKERRHKERPPLSSDLLDYSELGEIFELMKSGHAWEPIFKDLFVSRIDFEASFLRLMYARQPISHARWLTKEDFAMLLVESMRILRALGKTDQ